MVILLLGSLLAACGSSNDVYLGDYCTPKDPGLTEAFREALNLTDDQIPCDLLARLTRLNANAYGIKDLSGIEAAGQLQLLALVGNKISDLTPLAKLKKLTGIDLGGNEIRDLSPLADLPVLEELYLDLNYVSDLSPLVANPGLRNGKALYLRLNCLDLSADSPIWPDLLHLLKNIDDVRYERPRDCEEVNGMLQAVEPVDGQGVLQQAVPQL